MSTFSVSPASKDAPSGLNFDAVKKMLKTLENYLAVVVGFRPGTVVEPVNVFGGICNLRIHCFLGIFSTT
jgi:hypothetical protein